MAFSWIDLSILFVYLGAILSLGVYFAKKGQTSERFMTAGGSLSGWVVGLSIVGTYVSSISFLANPGKSYHANWNPWVFGLSLPLAAWIATKFFVPFYRKSKHISAYHHLEQRFGPWARTYGASIYVLLQLGRMGTILYLMALPLHHFLAWPIWTVITFMGVLVIFYTLIGGIEVVIWTDVVQTIVLVCGAVTVVVILILRMPGGLGEIISIAGQHGKFSLGSFGPSLFESTFWVVFLFGLFENIRNFGIDQSYIQRYLTAASEKEARKSVWLGALAYLPISALLFFIGTALFAYYTLQPELLPASLQGLNQGDQMFPFFIVTALPEGFRGLLIAGIFAAGMSSVDSSLNCSATLVLSDFYKRYFRLESGEKESMRVLQISTISCGVLAIGLGLSMIGIKSALDLWWKLSGALGGGILGLFLLGFISQKTKNNAAILGVCTGIAVISWMSLTPLFAAKWGLFVEVQSPFHGFLSTVFGTLAVILVGFLLTFVTLGLKKSK